MSEDFSKYVTAEQIIQRARQNLSQGPWDYLAGASESETTMRKSSFTTCKNIEGKCPAWSISADEVTHKRDKKTPS